MSHAFETPEGKAAALSEVTAQDGREALVTARYRRNGAVPAGEWNAVLDLILAHRSVRSYLPDALPEGTIETLVAAGQSAPSSSNLQTWSVVAVSDPARKARLAEVTGNQKHILQAPLLP